MLGFGALGEFALGEGPTSTSNFVGGSFSQPLKRAGLTAAVIATTFVGFVPPPQAQAATFSQFSQPYKKPPQVAVWSFVAAPASAQTALFTPFSQPAKKPVQIGPWSFVAPPAQAPIAIFTSFSQPVSTRGMLPDEQPSVLFEVLVPPAPPFTGFARFADVVRPKSQVFLYSGFLPTPFVVPIDTHDGVWIKRKKKRHGKEPIDLELEERQKRRAAISLAVYGPEVTYEEPAVPVSAVEPPKPPPDVTELVNIMVAKRAAELESQRRALEQDDEDVIEMILRDL